MLGVGGRVDNSRQCAIVVKLYAPSSPTGFSVLLLPSPTETRALSTGAVAWMSSPSKNVIHINFIF